MFEIMYIVVSFIIALITVGVAAYLDSGRTDTAEYLCIGITMGFLWPAVMAAVVIFSPFVFVIKIVQELKEKK